MNLTSVPLLDVLRERMSWLSARQNVLSQNVANVDTPNYSAIDLKPIDFEKLMKQSTEPPEFQGGLTVTDPNHIAVAPQSSGYEKSIDKTGDAVSVEEEMMKVADTQAQYQAATNIYAKAISMMRTAIDKSGP
jgi:flagellar basal-body rod protein FlgB